MNKLYERIKSKKIIIFGIGELQRDIEGIYNLNVVSYIDDFNRDNVKLNQPVYHSEQLKIFDKSDVFVIVCEKDSNYCEKILHQCDYENNVNYCLVEYLLINSEFFHRIKDKKTILYGYGNTYTYFKNELDEYLNKIEFFLVTKKDSGSLSADKSIVELSDYEAHENEFIIVSSIYYDDISEGLQKKNLSVGKDFIHIYTFIKLAELSIRAEGEHSFTDRSKGAEELLVILAGYKPFVWDNVFTRFKEYIPENIDVCMVTSGLVNTDLQKLCHDYGWSYVSTKMNNVSFAVNLCVHLHEKAKYIYKIDEDIFITKGCFERLRYTYDRLERESGYEVAFVTPTIPVNGFGYVDVLQHFNAVELWKERFGDLYYTDCYNHHRMIHDNPDAARMMWGEGAPQLADIDIMNEKMQNMSFHYNICPIRYSIGFILFSKENWMRMHMFPVQAHTNMGADEIHICQFALMSGRIMVESLNTLVGHLSYGPQHKAMEEYYFSHPEIFACKEHNKGEEKL